MNKHTPGPWTVSYRVDGITVDTAQPVRFNLTTAGTAVIARVCAHEDAEHFSGEANALLIAAAPDLLKALKVALRQNEHDMLMTGEECRQCWAAIAKAEGV